MSAVPSSSSKPRGRQLLGNRRQAGGHQRDDRDVARVHARCRCRVDRLGGDALDLHRAAGTVGDEAAAAVASRHQPVGLELRVRGANGVDVDPGPFGEVADARQALARSEPAGGDQRPQAPAELDADGEIVGMVGLEWGGERLCHLTHTVIQTCVIVN